MANFFDITHWNEKIHFQTKGTRNKCVVEQPETGDLFYFKTSLQKKNRDYKHEFWSEILASEIGKALGFNVLEYHIAYKNDIIGCISKSMISQAEELVEGTSILTGYDSTYNPEDKSTYSTYTFDFIRNAFILYDLNDHIYEIIRIVIFDSIIGNSDRHQENWGIINPLRIVKVKDSEGTDLTLFKKIKKVIFSHDGKIVNITVEPIKGKFAPIYDSGCCLVREYDDNVIDKMLGNANMIEAYVNKGKAEIRWNGDKLNHFDLVRKIYEQYEDFVNSEIEKVCSLFNEDDIKRIVQNVDSKLPSSLKYHKLPQNRKDVIIKILFLRYNKLKEILK